MRHSLGVGPCDTCVSIWVPPSVFLSFLAPWISTWFGLVYIRVFEWSSDACIRSLMMHSYLYLYLYPFRCLYLYLCLCICICSYCTLIYSGAFQFPRHNAADAEKSMRHFLYPRILNIPKSLRLLFTI